MCLPAKENVTVCVPSISCAGWDGSLPVSIKSTSCSKSTPCSQLWGIIFRCEGLMHGVSDGVAYGEKPGATTQPVIPPLFLHPGLILARVHVLRPLARGGGLRRSLEDLSAEAKLV